MPPLKVGSCFSGVGGFDLGLEAAGGFETVWYSDISPAANRVMADRFPRAQPLGDIRTLTAGLFPPPPVDVLAGGPPCQGISKGNAYGRHGLADPRSALFHEYADLVALLQPTWVVMEQVTGLLTSGPAKGDDYRTVTDTYRTLGYETSVLVVNSLAYVPQTRERLVFIGHRDPGAAPRALLPLRKDGARHPDEDRPPRRRPSPAVEDCAGIYRKGRRPGSNTDAETWVPTDYAPTLTLNDVGVSRATVIVIDAAGRPRVLTPEEWEACHGFPTGWTIAAGTDAARWAALGNAVSPPVAERIGAGIAAVELEAASGICIECGNDDATVDYLQCTDCLEEAP